MTRQIKAGAVIFAGDHARLARFYAGLTGMAVTTADDRHTVLESDAFELVIHALPGATVSVIAPEAREDSYHKLFFPVASLAQARTLAQQLGGGLKPSSSEWEARGFRACDGVDAEGNIIQLRELVSGPVVPA